jgi:hypothetical protein
MKLSETNEQIKADLMKFVNGEYDNHFNTDQIAMVTELSFLLNHISSEGDSIIFKYNNNGEFNYGCDFVHIIPVSSTKTV